MTTWQPVIGLETHVQLRTKSKLFSVSPASFTSAPNTHANELDFGMPGTLPVLNQEAVTMAIKLGLALGSRIQPLSWFARKHYFYPDLPKGYQISQYTDPVLSGGTVEVTSTEKPFSVELVRAHLEEDAGKLMHDVLPNDSVVDLNRAGVPLLEIVTEPVLRSSADASSYGKALRELVCWIGICDGNMQEGSLRFDVNVSLRACAEAPLGTRCEVKNLNSFRFMEQAIEYEIARQGDILSNHGEILQETRLFDTSTGKTRSMRSKEDAEDYRYMNDPDLPPLLISDESIDQCRAAMPELPTDCRVRLQTDLGLSEYDARVLTASRQTVDYFETVTAACGDPKTAANWITGDLTAMCKTAEVAVADCPVPADRLSSLLKLIADGTISGKMAKQLLERMWQDPQADPQTIVAAEGIQQISDSDQLETILAELIVENPKQAEQFRAGKDKLLGFFVGQAMKATNGQANPQQLNEIALRLLQK